jgi:glycolate oxidase FAD binding subunit
MSTLEKLAVALQAVVGVEHLYTEPAAVTAYAIDGVVPAMVVLPADPDQVAAVLRYAHEHQATVFPRGGGSYMTLGHTPACVDVVLSLQRLRRQLAYEPGDMTTTVEAGVCLAELQQILGRSGQFLALDPPATAITTVGGVVAANVSGPRRLLYGTARDVLLGVAVLGVDGQRTKAGGQVVKNVTGYDLNKLYVGSLGTLAVIVELTFKVHPLPPGEATLGIGCAHHDDLLPVLQAAIQLSLRLNSLELLNAPASAGVLESIGLPAVTSAYLVVARVEGTPKVAASQQQRLIETLCRLPLKSPPIIYRWDTAEQERLWTSITAYPHAASANAVSDVSAKISLRMSDLPAFLHAVQAVSTVSSPPWSVLVHAGSGIAYVRIPARPAAGPDTEALLAQLQGLDTCVAQVGGRRVIERAPVAVKQRCQVWGAPGDDFALMRAIKVAFDPHGRLNPGRFLGGL